MKKIVVKCLCGCGHTIIVYENEPLYHIVYHLFKAFETEKKVEFAMEEATQTSESERRSWI